jgi:hypothetical protein
MEASGDVKSVNQARISRSACCVSERTSMAILTYRCPHCRTEYVGLRVVSFMSIKNWQCAAHLMCPKCNLPSCGILDAPGGANIRPDQVLGHPGDLLDDKWQVLEFWPTPPAPAIPEHIPDAVGRALLQAERNAVTAGNEEAAGIMYRKALDLAITSIAADVKGNLKSRIEKLVERHDLTPSLGDWANQIRVLGNEAAHEEEPPTRDDLEALRGFTGLVLQYLFTLPAQVKMRKLLA